ncbi:MAG TPA: FAD-dependent oxidoreductase [Acidimicrobiales bacterium]|nr:FAD-dependent oxidoreductase [Acidimicrobiales bacterium]
MGSLQETNPSVWVATTPASSYRPLPGPLDTDAVVVGAGIVGLTAAILLQQRGRRVVVVEAGRVASGTTGYTTAKLSALHGLIYDELAQAYGDAVALKYADANLAGIAQVAELVDHYDIACDLQTRPAFTYTCDPEMVDTVRAEVAAARRISLPVSFTTDTDLPFPVDGAIRLDDQAQFHPRKYCLGLAAAVAGGDGSVYERTRALSVDEDDHGRCRVVTDRGTVTADHVIEATQLPFSDKGGFFARTYPVRSYVLGVRVAGAPPQGMYLAAGSPSRSVRSAPVEGGELVLVGGEGHKVGQDDDTARRYRALEDWARGHFSVEAVDYRWSAQDYMPVDRLPFVGPLAPGSPRVLVATGFQKWGMSNGSAAAIMLVDRITGVDNPWAEVFDSNRLNVRQSVSDVVKENADVVKRFIGDRLRTATDRSVDELALGHAAVLTIGTERVAAYRDDAGTVHAVSPVCTHLGCTVTWNTAELTWDCPCHGSRFDCDGHVVQGPAVRDLAPRDEAG